MSLRKLQIGETSHFPACGWQETVNCLKGLSLREFIMPVKREIEQLADGA